MAEYLEHEKVLDENNIITVQTKEYGSIEVIPVDTITDIELADVQPVDRWISVDEALPEKDGYYLVVTQGIHNPTIDIAGFWHYAEWVQKEIRENYWNKYDKVLYWQPLPDLP